MAERQKSVGIDLTEGKILPQLLRFVLPLLLANVVQQLYNTVDMVPKKTIMVLLNFVIHS